jgi:hypothetical protein
MCNSTQFPAQEPNRIVQRAAAGEACQQVRVARLPDELLERARLPILPTESCLDGRDASEAFVRLVTREEAMVISPATITATVIVLGTSFLFDVPERMIWLSSVRPN